MADVMNLVGRILISLVFLGGFAQKMLDPGPVRGMIEGIGLPGNLIWPVALLNLAGVLGLVLGPGVKTVRFWGLVLAAYCIFTSYFHWQLRADPWQVTIVVKNWAIAGGLLILAASGPGRYVVGGRSQAT
ncbi:DoxX family protein [uncultured Maritimibacter sp.]|jgi:putative oxidoreductase|uniref:DoxX family protein n=1 Tax=uncultured Maritimibacter sp. TaxID=991866 RepID=UPI000B2C63F5|nr:DoxX family protein [uncultured Maritimibacter sp.]